MSNRTNTIDIAIAGASGRMGKRLIALARETSYLRIVAALVSSGSKALGTDSDGPKFAAELDPNVRPNVLIDFSSPAGTRNWVDVCKRRQIPILIGTTGLTDADQQQIDGASLLTAVLQATNTSLGVAVLNHVAAVMTRMLGEAYDIEVVESHHKNKKDAPSGTAITLADRILAERKRARDALEHGRFGHEALRKPGTVGMHSLRMGDVVGEHTAHFAGDGERLSITHQATSRDTFARGALHAARWLASKGAGRYRMEDVLGISG